MVLGICLLLRIWLWYCFLSKMQANALFCSLDRLLSERRYPSVFDRHITHRLGCLTCPKHDMQIHAVHEHILTQVVTSRQILHVSNVFGCGSVVFFWLFVSV